MIKKLLIAYLFTISSVMAGLPPTVLKGQSQSTKPTTFNFQVPNKQATITAASTGLIETGNNNELENRGFEHSTVTTGWTISNATSSSSTTRIEGGKSLSLALTGALSLSQSSTINASQKSGVQMVASVFVNSSDVSDLRLCSLKNGAEDKCTATGGYVQGSGWRQLTVSFLGDSTSNGLKLKSTDTSGTVLVDQAYVGLGSPIVDFTPDMVYTAEIKTTTGVVTKENVGFIASCTATNQSVCTFVGGIFTTAPNCTLGSDNWAHNITNVTSTGFSLFSFNTTSAAAVANISAFVTCVKTGADYKTSKAYVASSSDYDWTVFTPTSPNSSITFTSPSCYKKREGSDLLLRCNAVIGAGGSSGSTAQMALPDSLTTSSTLSTSTLVGVRAVGSNTATSFYTMTQPSIGYITFSVQNGTSNSQTLSTGGAMADTQPQSWYARIPIQGWTDSGVIVGSFQGYNETPGTSRVETFSVSYGTSGYSAPCNASPCSYLDQIGSSVTSITRSGPGAYSLNLSKTYSKLKCSLTASSGASSNNVAYSPSTLTCSTACSALAFDVRYSSGLLDVFGTILCQGIPQ